MKPDTSLPTTDEELRDWLICAWEDGWRSRRSLIGQPMGTIIDERDKRLIAFLKSWDLPAVPPVFTRGVREAIAQLAKIAEQEQKDGTR